MQHVGFANSDLSPGGPNVLLTHPNRIRRIGGDGNCLFRCFSYVITGSEQHHRAIRSALIQHMPNLAHVFTTSNVRSVEEYVRNTRMDRDGTWGNTEEVMALSHLLNTQVYSYVPNTNTWVRITPDSVDTSLYTFNTDKAIYIQNASQHFTVVMSTLPYATN